jgi:hypothetical protein
MLPVSQEIRMKRIDFNICSKQDLKCVELEQNRDLKHVKHKTTQIFFSKNTGEQCFHYIKR